MGLFSIFKPKKKRGFEKQFTQLMSDALKDGSSAAGKAMARRKKDLKKRKW